MTERKIAWSNVADATIAAATPALPLHVTGGSDALVTSFTAPGGGTLQTAQYVPAMLIPNQKSDDVLAKGGTEIVIRLRYTLNFPAAALPGGISIGFGSIAGLPTQDMTYEAITPGLPAGNGYGSWAGIAPVAGENVYEVRARVALPADRLAVSVTGSVVLGYSTPVPVAADSTVTARLEAWIDAALPDIGGGGTPSVLHFRDPADGVFKPLTEVRVPGFDDPPVTEPDYGAARIVWGTDNLIAPDYAAARVAATYGTIPGLRVTPVTDGVRIQADAWHHESGSTPTANIEIPLTWDALAALVADERAVRPTCRLDNVNAGGIITIQIVLANDVMTAGGAGFNLTAGATTVGQDLAVVNSPGATVSRDPILNTLTGANPRLIYKISYMAFGPTDFPAMDVTVRHISIVAQEVAAP